MSGRRSDLTGLVDVVGTAPHGIRRLLLRVVIEVGRALPFGNGRVGFDEAALVVDTQES